MEESRRRQNPLLHRNERRFAVRVCRPVGRLERSRLTDTAQQICVGQNQDGQRNHPGFAWRKESGLY
jgi:hypothetical protein